MPCECGHQIRDHRWRLYGGDPQKCNRCNCKGFKEELDEKKIDDFIKRGIW